MSYGNGWTKLDFNDKLNIINASNGSGKSVIIDAISFVLFGKPYRDIKMKSLVNYINKRHLEVEIEFDIGRDKYKMMRGLAPSKFKLTKNGEEIDNLSSKKLNQMEIDKLLGVRYLLFKNVMCIGAISNVPFFNMSLPDRRELLETIFGLTNIADMLKEVKLRNSNNKMTLSTSTVSKTGILNSINDMNNFIDETKKRKLKFKEIQNGRIVKIREHIDEQKSQIEDHRDNIKKCEDKLEEIGDTFDEIDNVKIRINERNTSIVKHEAKIEDLKTRLSNRDQAVCPVCGTDMCSEHAVKYFEKLESYLREEQSSLAILKPLQEKDENALSVMQGNKKLYDAIVSRLVQEKGSIVVLDRGIAYDEDQISEIETDTGDFDTAEKEEKLAEYQEQLRLTEQTINETAEEIAIDTDLIEVLSDNGIKKYFFDQIVPIINIKVNEYIRKFGLDHTIYFDSLLDYTITRGAFEMEYNGLSNGEKTRVNVAMLLTFYDIAKQLSNWSSSILFIDEIFDTGIDAEGISDFLQELVSMLNRDNNLGVYLISHKLNVLNLNKISYETLKVQKRGMFSQIVKD
jgi:DNA repair exonuclease SbcCD ATPase subunit